MKSVRNYFSGLSAHVGARWTHFWFEPLDLFPLSVLRIGAGLMAFYYVYSHTADLLRWFGPRGLLPIETVEQFTGGMENFRFSYFNFVDVPGAVWTLHIIGALVVLLFLLGLFTRVTSVLSLIVVLSYVHRAPMLTGQFEPVLTMVLFYLCLAPCGSFLSLDAWWHRRRGERVKTTSPLGTISLRLIQVHLTLFYLMMGLTKLAGQTWWAGSAVWWLIAHPESRLVDWTALHAAPYLINAWTHAIVVFELAFGVLVWNRWARPLLLVIAVPMWLLLIPITGLVSFCVMILIANLAFVPADWLRAALGRSGEAHAAPVAA